MKVSTSVYFVSEGQIARALALIIGQVIIKRNVTLLFGGGLESSQYIFTCSRSCVCVID